MDIYCGATYFDVYAKDDEPSYDGFEAIARRKGAKKEKAKRRREKLERENKTLLQRE